jgi:hypothetical protein
VQWRFAPEDLFQIEPIRKGIPRLQNHWRTDVPAVS